MTRKSLLIFASAAALFFSSAAGWAEETPAHSPPPVEEQMQALAGQGQEDNVVCREIAPTGTNIRHTFCFTRTQIEAEAEQGRLDADALTGWGTQTGA